MIVDLTPSDDQRMIEDSVLSFLSDHLPVERLRETTSAGGAAESALWGELAALGLFGMGISEDAGGLGLGLAEEALVARALGRHLASPSVLAQMIAPHIAEEARQGDLISGATRAAFANSLDDSHAHLIDGNHADMILLMRDSGSVLLQRDTAGAAAIVQGMDETVSLARISLSASPTTRSSATERASLLIAAYLTGIAQGATALAVDYAKVREQFGQPIGAFQAIKHQCADMATRAAACDAQTFHAAVTFGHGLDDASEVAAARMLAGRAALANAKANIQIHGGMGFTAECDAHLFLKRATLMNMIGNCPAAERHRLLGYAA